MSRRQLVSGTAAALACRAIGAVVAFLFNVLLARTLGVEGAGVYYLSITVVLFCATLSRMGLELLTLRTISASAAQGDLGSGVVAYRKFSKLVLRSSLGVAGLVAALAPVVARVSGKPELLAPLMLVAPAIPCVALMVLNVEAIKGLKKVIVSVSLWNLIFPAACLICVIGLARWKGIIGATGGYVLAAALVAVLSGVLWRRLVQQAVSDTAANQAASPTGHVLRQSMRMLVVILAGQGDAWLPSLVLGVFRPTADVGAFNVAWRVSLLLTFGLMAVNAIAAPVFAEQAQAQDHERLATTTRDALFMSAVLAVLPGILLVAAPSWVLSFFGPGFETAAPTLAIIAVGQAVNVALGPLGYLLLMSGHERVVRNTAAIFLLVNLCVSLALAPFLGAVGAALATASSLVLRNVVLMRLVRRRMAIRIPFPGMKLRIGP